LSSVHMFSNSEKFCASLFCLLDRISTTIRRRRVRRCMLLSKLQKEIHLAFRILLPPHRCIGTGELVVSGLIFGIQAHSSLEMWQSFFRLSFGEEQIAERGLCRTEVRVDLYGTPVVFLSRLQLRL